jgi:adenine phosphoribosyltransferase
MDIKKYIREIPDWPIKNVNFKDITTLLQDPKLFKYIINQMTKPFFKKKVDKVVAVDARGFILAGPIAYRLGSGVCLVRKKGKLPFKAIREKYRKEYGFDVLTIHKDTIKKGEKVLIVDDLLATGGTMTATTRLVERLGGKIIGITFIIDLPFLGGSKKLAKYPLYFLTSYDQE